MEPPMSVPDSLAAKPKFACVRCAERKVKCNRQNPCEACIRHNAQCIFRPPKPPRRRRRNQLIDKLVEERLAAILQDKATLPSPTAPEIPNTDDDPVDTEPASLNDRPRTIVPDAYDTTFRPMLLQGQGSTKLLNNSLWARVAEEMHRDGDEGFDDDSLDGQSETEFSNDGDGYVLDMRSPRMTFSHPPASFVWSLWQSFVDNVNPLLKMVHIPSLRPAFERALSNINGIPRGFEALMFSIYSLAVLSMSDSDCHTILGEARSKMLSYYISATKAALSRARFMSTNSIVVIQALTLHIVSIRDHSDWRAVWNMTGLAIRIAEGMGMGIDGSILGLSPFESEIRRRIWWQIRMHDFRAAELSGQDKFKNFELNESTPKRPANVNDSDLFPAMNDPPEESDRPTEMLWCTLRTELAGFAAQKKEKMQKLGPKVFTSEDFAVLEDAKVKDAFIQEMEDVIETKYLRFCDPTDTLQYLVSVVGRGALDLIKFIAHHPRRWKHMTEVPAIEREFVWKTAIRLLGRYKVMQTSEQLRPFAWNTPYYIQWHAVIHVLDTLRMEPTHPEVGQAWELINSLYECNSEMLLKSRKPIFVAVGGLCLKAFHARQVAQTTNGMDQNRHIPTYISVLREERSRARARRAAASSGLFHTSPIAESIQSQSGFADGPSHPAATSEPSRHGSNYTKIALEAQQPLIPLQGAGLVCDDAFWLGNTVDGGLAGTVGGDMHPDATVYAQDDAPYGAYDEALDWTRWDTWLARADLMQPYT